MKSRRVALSSELTDLHGNTTGLSPSDVHALERLYRRRVPFDRLLTPELARSMSEVSFSTGRQVGVLADRTGDVRFVVVGDANKLFLPDLGRVRAADGRFRGLRLIHTHLNLEGLTRDDLVDLVRLRLDLIAAICLGPSGAAETVTFVQVANLARALGLMRDAGVRAIGAVAEAEASLYDEDLAGPTALVLGGEAQGLRRLTRERCDRLVHLPMRGEVESLNVAVTAGICVYEAVRQRRRRP